MKRYKASILVFLVILPSLLMFNGCNAYITSLKPSELNQDDTIMIANRDSVCGGRSISDFYLKKGDLLRAVDLKNTYSLPNIPKHAFFLDIKYESNSIGADKINSFFFIVYPNGKLSSANTAMMVCANSQRICHFPAGGTTCSGSNEEPLFSNYKGNQ